MTARPLSRRGQTFIALWCAALTLLAASVGRHAIRSIQASRESASERHGARLNVTAQDSGDETNLPPGIVAPKALLVTAGIYVDRFVEISLRESHFSVDFSIWFRWSGEGDPGESFQVVDGRIESKERLLRSDEGAEHYALYRVNAEITKFFDASRFPLDDHLVTIAIEDAALQSYQQRYVADSINASVSSRARAPGFEILDATLVVKPHAYKTNRGDLRLPSGFSATYSQLRYGIPIQRGGLALFFRLFQGLFASVALSMLVFFIKPSDVDPRFGIGVGAFFAAMANNYVISSELPTSGATALTDLVNLVGLATIFLSVAQSTISLHILTGRDEAALSARFDRASFVVMAITYPAINVAIVWAATG